MAASDIKVKINVEGLEKLGRFLDKYGDRVKLVGSFEFKPGDVLFFEAEGVLSQDAVERTTNCLQKILPEMRTVILNEINLVGVGRNRGFHDEQ